MPTARAKGGGAIVVSALSLRTNLGKILRRLDAERRSLVIEKRGTPTAVLMNIRALKSGRADFLITGSRKHFPAFWKNTKVIMPRKFVSLVAPHLIR
jgi:hypothetical protein